MLDARQKLLFVLGATFLTCFLVGDILGGKLIEMDVLGMEFTTTVGMVPFPITFLLTDVLNEFYGKKAARFVTLVSFAMALLAFFIIYVAGAIPIALVARGPEWTGVNEASFNNVFLGSQRMLLASLCAFLVSQFVDIWVFHFLKELSGSRLLWLRATGSTLISQLIDTVVITLAAWIGVLSGPQILDVILSAYALKVFIAVGLTPIIYVCHRLLIRRLGIQPWLDEGTTAGRAVGLKLS